MKVKKYTAKDMPEAMKKIRADLGEDAVILNSKHVDSGGIFRIFKKKNVEVIAAIDENAPLPPRKKSSVKKEREPEKREVTQIARKDGGDIGRGEVNELKEMIASLKQHTPLSPDGHPEPIQKIEHILHDQEVKASIRKEILNKLLSHWYREERPDVAMVREKAKSYLAGYMKEAGFGPRIPPKKMINLVGPTGVGKTTTIAKIAAYYHLEKKMSVAFITTDTYRIAAVEQLKTYAKILDVPIEVAYSMEDFQLAKEKFKEKDVILVDSAGRNFQNALYVEELKKMVHFDEDMDTYLVLALTSKWKDMKNIYDQFSLIPINKFIFTKKDETASYGAIINMSALTSIGAAYITHGQNVPDDIEAADPDKVASWMLEEADYE